MNHYPHHIGDYTSGTLGFTTLEHGVYRLLMDAYYSAEEAPHVDDVYEIAKAKTPADRKAVEKVLARKFELRDGRYYHERIEAEIEAYRQRADTARENGRKGGKKPKPNPRGTESVTDRVTKSDTKSVSGSVPTSEAESKLASSHKPVNPSTPQAQHSGGGGGEAASDRVAALLSVCKTDGRIPIDRKAELHARQWAGEGVTDQHLADAIAIGRERKPHPELLHAGYLATILPDVVRGVARPLNAPRGEDAVAIAMANLAKEEAANAPH